nr:KOW domain-containing RNA-binding protein [uncultured Solibaculum sp.]
MQLVKGRVVMSTAGRDRLTFQIVLEAAPDSALVVDGKARPLQRPKRKNIKHLSLTGTVVPEEQMSTNREIRRALRPFQSDGAVT